MLVATNVLLGGDGMVKPQKDHNRCTSERILYAAIDLIADKGYKSVTTKEIAAVSQVSEMTVFRHFGNKRAILEKAIEKYSSICIDHVFSDLLQWELQHDLLLISQTYMYGMIRNDKVFLILIKEGKSLYELDHEITKHPVQLQKSLSHYFRQMEQKGKVISGDSDMQASAFIRMNLGTYATHLIHRRHETTVIDEQQMEQLLLINTQIFARGLTP